MKESFDDKPVPPSEKTKKLFAEMHEVASHPETAPVIPPEIEIQVGVPVEEAVNVEEIFSTQPQGFVLEGETVGEPKKETQEKPDKKPKHDSVAKKKKTGAISTAAAIDKWQRDKEAEEQIVITDLDAHLKAVKEKERLADERAAQQNAQQNKSSI